MFLHKISNISYKKSESLRRIDQGWVGCNQMDGFDKNMKKILFDSAQNFQTIKKQCLLFFTIQINRYSRDQIMSSLSKLISKRKKTTFMWSHQVSGKKRRKHHKRSPMLLSHDGSPIPNSSQIHQISDKSSLHHHDELSLLFQSVSENGKKYLCKCMMASKTFKKV